MGQQVLDRHAIIDQRQVVAEHRTSGRGERERAVLDQAHHRERCETLRPTRDREPCVDRVGDLVRSVGEAIRPGELGLAIAVHTHNTRQRASFGSGIDRSFERVHPSTVPTTRRSWPVAPCRAESRLRQLRVSVFRRASNSSHVSFAWITPRT